MRLRLWLVAACLATPASPGMAASFDCAKAARAVEERICADPALSRADEELAGAFAAALAATLDPQSLRAGQREWLARRDKLGDAAALARAYRSRIEALRSDAASWQALPRELAAKADETECLALPEAPADAQCRVEEAGAVAGEASGLRYRLQVYRDGELRLGGGVVVLAGIPGKPGRLSPIAASYAEQGVFAAPEAIDSPAGALLLIPGHLEGTGDFNVESLYLVENGRLRDIETGSWQSELARRLPKGLAVWKGVYPDYAKMTATTALWREGDANCCPSGGRASIRLVLREHRLAIVSLTVKRGAAAAREEEEGDGETAPEGGTVRRGEACGQSVAYDLDLGSFRGGPAADDPEALATARQSAPILIERAFAELCEARALEAADIARRVARIVIVWAGGADDFTAFFRESKARPGMLVTQWIWQGDANPELADVRAGLLCAFKPKSKGCAERGP